VPGSAAGKIATAEGLVRSFVDEEELRPHRESGEVDDDVGPLGRPDEES
jgi:hypothetical protein